MSQLRNILGLREEIEIYNVGPGQGADIIIFRFIFIDLSSLVPAHCAQISQRGLMLQQILQGFDLTRVFRLPSGLFTSQEDSLTDWLILIKLFVVDKLICPLHTFHIANIDCYIVKTCTYKLSQWSAWIILIIDLTPYCLLVNSGTLTLIHHLWKLPLPDPPDWLCSKCLIAVRGRPDRLTDLYSFSFFFLTRPFLFWVEQKFQHRQNQILLLFKPKQ